MAATVTNLEQGDALNSGAMTLAIVGGADQAFPAASGAQVGIDGTTNCQQLENAGTPLVADDFYSAWVSFGGSSYDLSTVDSSATLHFKNNSPGFNALKAFRCVYFSGGGTTNYGSWNFAATSTTKNGSFHTFTVEGTPDATGGTFDDTDITGGAFLAQALNTDVFGFQISIDQIVFVQGPAVFEDTGGAATVSQEDYFNLVKATSGTVYHSLLAVRAGPTFEYGFPISIQSDDYANTSPSNGIAFKAGDGEGFPTMPLGYYQLEYIGQAAGSQVETNASLATIGPDFDLTIDGSASTTDITMTSVLIAGVRNVTISGSGTTIVGGTVSDPTTIDIADGDLQLTINNSTNPIVWSADLVAGSTITTDSDMGITFDVGNYGDINWTFTANNEVTVDPTTDASTYTLSGFVNTGFSTNFDIPSGNNFDSTVEITASFTATRTGPPTTGGGEIFLSAPAVALDVTALNLIDDTRVLLYNVTTDLPIENVVVSGGSGYTKTITAGTDFTSGDSITLLATYQQAGVAKEVFRGTGVATTTDIILTDSQVNWDFPNALGLDGSTFTEFVTDYVGIQVEVVDSDNITAKSRIAAFMVDAITTSDGISNWVSLAGNAAISYSNAGAAQVDAAVAAVEVFNNKAASTLLIQDTFEFDWSDGVDRVAALVGASVLWLSPARVLTISTGSVLTAPQQAELTAASQASTVNTKIGTPVVTVSDDLSAVKTVVDTSDSKIDLIGTKEDIADTYLGRTIAGGANGGRTVKDALRANRNRVVVDADLLTITVYEEDDTTVAWSGSIATGSRDPINSVDPA